MLRGITTYVRRHHVALLALFVALGGTAAAAGTALVPKNSVGSAQVINGSLQRSDLALRTIHALHGAKGPRGPRGLTGANGAPGAQGLKGDTGSTGPQGIVSVRSVIGQINLLTSNGAWTFAGPTATFNVGANQAITGTGSASLGISAGTVLAETYLCYQNAAGGAVTQFGADTTHYQLVNVTTNRTIFSSSGATIPGAGSWKVGYCVNNNSGSALDASDWASGVYEVVNAPSVAAPTVAVGKAHVG
jgi:hypothetical protein